MTDYIVFITYSIRLAATFGLFIMLIWATHNGYRKVFEEHVVLDLLIITFAFFSFDMLWWTLGTGMYSYDSSLYRLSLDMRYANWNGIPITAVFQLIIAIPEYVLFRYLYWWIRHEQNNT